MPRSRSTSRYARRGNPAGSRWGLVGLAVAGVLVAKAVASRKKDCGCGCGGDCAGKQNPAVEWRAA